MLVKKNLTMIIWVTSHTIVNNVKAKWRGIKQLISL